MFLVIISGYLAFSVNYNKAFKVNLTSMIQIMEAINPVNRDTDVVNMTINGIISFYSIIKIAASKNKVSGFCVKEKEPLFRTLYLGLQPLF